MINHHILKADTIYSYYLFQTGAGGAPFVFLRRDDRLVKNSRVPFCDRMTSLVINVSLCSTAAVWIPDFSGMTW